MNPEHKPRRRYLQDVGNIDPAALPQRLQATEAHDADEEDADEEDDPGLPAPGPPEQARPTLTGSQAYRVRRAASSLRELQDVAFLDMSPTDQVLYFDRLRRDNEELLRIIRLIIGGT